MDMQFCNPRAVVHAGQRMGWRVSCAVIWALVSGVGTGASVAGTKVQEQQIFDQMRTAPSQKRPFLEVDPILSSVARARARDMAERNFFGHVNPDGVGANLAVDRAGYKLPDGWTDDPKANYIESIAAGFTSSGAVWQAWMTSEGHRNHLLAQNTFYKNQTSVGVGYVYRENSKYKHYWVVLTAPPNRAGGVRIASPVSGSIVASGTLAVIGTVKNPEAVSKVEVSVESWQGASPWVEASGTASWSVAIPDIAPGKNTVWARSVNAEGKVLDTATVTVHYRVEVPFELRIEGEGKVAGMPMGTTSQALGYLYTLKAEPSKGHRFAGWTGTFPSAAKKLEVRLEAPAVVQANFVPDPFPARKGKYVGLLGGGRAGMLALNLGKRGEFSGKLFVEGKVMRVNGKFSPSGVAVVVLDEVALTLALDTAGDSGVTGMMADRFGDWPLGAAGVLRGEKSKYALELGPAIGVGAPDGTGEARVKVGKAGRARVSGILADGTTFLRGTFVTAEAKLPVHMPLYGNAGWVSGEVILSGSATGLLDWRKPAAFDAQIPVAGGLVP